MEHYDLYIGDYENWGTHPLGLSRDDRRRHCYLVGQTGTGKSTLLHSMITQDIHRGEGVVLIDPHGPLADRVLASVPTFREADVIVLDPANTDRPLGLNPLFGGHKLKQEDRERKASRLHAALKGIYEDSWGPELERVLMASLLSLMDAPDARPTLLSLLQFLDDAEYRQRISRHIKNRAAFLYVHKTLLNYKASEFAQKTSSTSNKVFQLVASSQLANVFGQYRPSFDFRRIMDDRKILIVRLNQGQLGEIYASLFGALLVSELLQAAFERSLTAGDDLADCYLYIDEFQKVRTSSIDDTLSEARKYRLNLILAHQYLKQINVDTHNAVFGNAGNTFAFRVSAEDAEELARHHTKYSPETYTGLDNGRVIASCLQSGTPRSPVQVRTPDFVVVYSDRRRQRICNVSAYRYGRTRQKVERAINRELGITAWRAAKANARRAEKTIAKQRRRLGQLIDRKRRQRR